MADEFADVVQPDQGQGDSGSGGAPYQEYLDRIPEQVRGDVEPIFKEWDANTTRRFQEHADFRKTWEPFEQTGVQNVDPERVQWAMQFLEAHDNNPSAIQDWFNGYAQEHDLQIAQQQEPAPEFDQFGLEDPSKQFEQLLEQRVNPLNKELQELRQFRDSLMQGAREAQAREQIDSQISEIRSKHPDEFNDVAEQFLEKLVGNYVQQGDPQAVQKGWSDFQALRNAVEKQVLQANVNATGGGAESGGPADANPGEVRTMADAKPLALDAIRAMFQGQ